MGTADFSPAGSSVGSHKIDVSGLSNTNYNISYATGDGRGTLTVTVRPITVTAEAKSKGQCDTGPALTYNITSGNLVGSDSLSGSLTREEGNSPGTYAIQQSSLTAGTNYAVTYVGANLTINASYTAAFQAPIKDGVRQVVKNGNVVLVKVRLTDCNSTSTTARTLSIRLVTGVIDKSDVQDGTEALVESVSSADTSGVMRVADGQYNYNLGTKGLTNGQAYTIVIRDTTGGVAWSGAPTVGTAVIEPRR